MLGVQNMSTFNRPVEDLNLDFSDRDWETRPRQSFHWPVEFTLHTPKGRNTDSEGSSGSESDTDSEGPHDVVDMDDEYFFDHGLEFPKPNVSASKPLSGTSVVLTTGTPNGDISHIPNTGNTIEGGKNKTDLQLDNKDIVREVSVDENKNEKRKTDVTETLGLTNGHALEDAGTADKDSASVNTLTDAIEKFSVAVSSVCTLSSSSPM